MSVLDEALPPLPGWPALGKPIKGPTDTSSAPKEIGNAALFGASGGLFGHLPGTDNFSIQSVVVILLGLLLIAAGIFSFREVRTQIITTVKTGAKAAAVA